MTHAAMREAAAKHLSRRCPKMRAVVKAVGPCTITLRRDRFGMLAHSILYQQISGHAAKAIERKLLANLPNGKLKAEGLASLDDETFRASGVSAQKAKYLRSLAELTLEGKVKLTGLTRWSDQAIIDELVQIKGVGVWTAQMFLIFSLGRPDVLPWDDLGVRSAMRKLFALEDLPKRDECEALAAPWRPYASVASWYCWRSLDVQDPGW
ncbi:MAG: DNA-3-methyladenine glycosylase [Bryobacterales bacterium]